MADDSNKNINEEYEPALKDVIRSQAREDERPNSASLSLRKILGGDYLLPLLRRNAFIIIIIVAFTIVYVANRYNVQQDLIDIATLKEKARDAQYKMQSASNELTELCRESNVQRLMKESGDSAIKVSQQPAFIVEIPEETAEQE